VTVNELQRGRFGTYLSILGIAASSLRLLALCRKHDA
jgi:hypothetical protein